jgi:hypothetical protein
MRVGDVNVRKAHHGHNLLYSGSTRTTRKTLLQEVVTTIWSNACELLSCIFSEVLVVNTTTH